MCVNKYARFVSFDILWLKVFAEHIFIYFCLLFFVLLLLALFIHVPYRAWLCCFVEKTRLQKLYLNATTTSALINLMRPKLDSKFVYIYIYIHTNYVYIIYIHNFIIFLFIYIHVYVCISTSFKLKFV